VGVLWDELFRRGTKIHFAHRTFSWQSEARGPAHVHVVIIGFALHDVAEKQIFEYDDINGEPTAVSVRNVNPYLVEGNDVTLKNRSQPLCDVPGIGIGNKPIDGGNYLFTPEQKHDFLEQEPNAQTFFRRWIGARELLNGIERWYLWLGDCPPNILHNMPLCMERVKAVYEFRKASRSAPTQRLADTPTRFHVEFLSEDSCLVIPRHSSERRNYIPFAPFTSEYLVGDACLAMDQATLYHFGVLTSAMHMAWVRHVCGRLESRYRYSAKLVYNNFPWPMDTTEAQRSKVEVCAQAVLDVRQGYLDDGSTLANLYDPLFMPAPLLGAHQALDRAVDRSYRSARFTSERERVEFLFQRYEALTTPLAPSGPAPRDRRASRTRRTT
jgi:hypothetical protein